MISALSVIPLMTVLAVSASGADRRPLQELVADLGSSSPVVRSKTQMELETLLDHSSHPLLPFKFHPLVWEKVQNSRREAKPLLPEIMKLLEREEPDVVGSAMGILAMMEQEAKPAIPQLKKLLNDSREEGLIQIGAAKTLVRVMPADEPVIPVILAGLKNSPVQNFADGDLQKIDELGPNADSQTVGTALFGVNYLAEAVLCNLLITGRTRIEVPALTQAASANSPDSIKVVAIAVLGGLGTEAKSALPVLRKRLQEKIYWIRSAAAYSILRIERNPAVIAELVETLGLPEAERKEFEIGARAALVEWKNEDRQIIESLNYYGGSSLCLGMLKHGSNFHQRQALKYLAALGPAAKSAVPDLKQRLNDADEEIRQLAKEALRRIEVKTDRNDATPGGAGG